MLVLFHIAVILRT